MQSQLQPNTTIFERGLDVVLIRFFIKCSQLFPDSFHICSASVPHIESKSSSVVLCSDLEKSAKKPPLTALPTSGDVASKMGTRNPNMCEASRHARDPAFVWSLQATDVVYPCACFRVLKLRERQVDCVTDKPPARHTMSVSLLRWHCPPKRASS